jgi:uncharacterized protein with GYD domain
MRKYLFYGSYTPEGYEGLLAEGGSARISVAKQALQSVGGSLEAFYYSNGEQDFYIIVNLPDDVCSTAITLAGNASGTFNMRHIGVTSQSRLANTREIRFAPLRRRLRAAWGFRFSRASLGISNSIMTETGT